ncbi:MAG: hypothetical protein K9J21_07120 [Bacteroidales bacterium]|nr:hypothetical protein [Bacteroidales bacterium]
MKKHYVRNYYWDDKRKIAVTICGKYVTFTNGVTPTIISEIVTCKTCNKILNNKCEQRGSEGY